MKFRHPTFPFGMPGGTTAKKLEVEAKWKRARSLLCTKDIAKTARGTPQKIVLNPTSARQPIVHKNRYDLLFKKCDLVKYMGLTYSQCATPIHSDLSLVDWLEYIWKDKNRYNQIFHNPLKENNLNWEISVHKNNVIFKPLNFDLASIWIMPSILINYYVIQQPLTNFTKKIIQIKLLQHDVTSRGIRLGFLLEDGMEYRCF